MMVVPLLNSLLQPTWASVFFFSPLEIKDDKPQLIGGIVGGASAFLLLLLLITGIVACL